MPEPLKTYRAKRDFTKTKEPSGRKRVTPGKRLRFVIQKHAATRLHYDLRLEVDGVFKSWAVTRGPSLDPHERRLAVEVEDHPLDYGDFEGVIPKGQYGGGTVMLWDRGYWELEKGKSIGDALKKGHLSFTFDGKRLHGGWSLVRIRNDRNGGKRNNWLLIKHDDETAHPSDDDALLDKNETSVASGRSMEMIAEGKGRAPTPFITRKKGKTVAASTPSVRNVAKKSALAPVVLGVAVSHPDKVLWPEAKDGPIKEAGTGRIHRSGCDLDAALCEGPAVFDHPHAGRRRRTELLPASHGQRNVVAHHLHQDRRREGALSAI